MAADVRRVAGADIDNSVAGIFRKLKYDPVMEAFDLAHAWLEKHERKFKGFVNGEFLTTSSGESTSVLAEFSQEKLCDVLLATDSDVSGALRAAHEAQAKWTSLPGFSKAKHLYSFARHVQKQLNILALVESLSTGKRLCETRGESIPHMARSLYHFAGWAMHIHEQFPDSQPLGVVAIIAEDSSPVHAMSAWRLSEILAAGNAAVILADPRCCLPALLLAEISAAAGLPKGLVNVLVGRSECLPAALLRSEMLAGFYFVGRSAVGQAVRRATAGSGELISCYHGGRPTVIVLEGSDQSSAADGVVETFASSCGKSESSGVQVFVQESIYKTFMSHLSKKFVALRSGPPNDKTSDVTPFKASWAKDISTSSVASKEVLVAPKEMRDKFSRLDEALLLPNVEPSSPIVADSVGHPVILVSQFRTTKESLALVNCCPQRANVSIWTEKLAVALEITAGVKVPVCFVNCQNLSDPAAEFGGIGMSGFGHLGGERGLLEFLRPSWKTKTPCDRAQFNPEAFGNKSDTRRMLPEACGGGDVQSIDQTFKLYYGGQQKRPESNSSHPVRNAKDEIVAYVPEAGKKDVRNAVESAVAGFKSWSTRDPHNRAQILYYIAENLSQRAAEFAVSWSRLTGEAEEFCQNAVELSVQRLFYWASACDKNSGKVQGTTFKGNILKLHEPFGVVGIVCPDSHPLLSFITLMAAAISHGNTAVILVGEKCPLPALLMYQVFETSDLPPGVVNILSGQHEPMVRTLAEHHDVQAVWYHGSSREAAAFVEYAAAHNLKRTWIGGTERNWDREDHCPGWEFTCHATAIKTVWLPAGDIFAN